MDENNVELNVELPDVEGMDYDMVNPGLSTGAKIGLGVAIGTAIGAVGSYVVNKVRKRRAETEEDKPKRGFIRLGKKRNEDVEDLDDDDFEDESEK